MHSVCYVCYECICCFDLIVCVSLVMSFPPLFSKIFSESVLFGVLWQKEIYDSNTFFPLILDIQSVLNFCWYFQLVSWDVWSMENVSAQLDQCKARKSWKECQNLSFFDLWWEIAHILAHFLFLFDFFLWLPFYSLIVLFVR